MVEMKNLKDYVKDELAKYVLVNCLVLLLISGDLKMDTGTAEVFSAVNILGGKIFSIAVIVFIMYMYTFIFNSMLTDKWRADLLWFFAPMPGEVIFKDIEEKSADARFTSERARQVFSEIYTELEKFDDSKKRRKYENQEWYRIYSELKEDSMVFYSNREYLLLRDMYISTWFMTGISLILWLCDYIHMTCCSIGFLVVLLLLTNIAARQKSRRFVYNVIAAHIGRMPSVVAGDVNAV